MQSPYSVLSDKSPVLELGQNAVEGIGCSRAALLAAHARVEETVPSFRHLLRHRTGQRSLFVMACDRSDQDREAMFQVAYRSLDGFIYKDTALRVEVLELTPEGAGIPDWSIFPETIVFRCLALEIAAAETMRDRLKEAFWKFKRCHRYECGQVLPIQVVKGPGEQEKDQVSPVMFRLRDFGLFLPATSAKNVTAIRTHSFHHGGGHFYRYRVATQKLASLGQPFRSVSEYLASLFEDCPNHLFRSGPRISAQKVGVGLPFVPSADHEIVGNATAATSTGRYKGAHDNVEVYFLENDPRAIASEVPVWADREELAVSGLAGCRLEYLTGHIDVLRCSGKAVEIWDYKPRSSNKQHAAAQVFLYAIVFSIRTGWPREQIVCGFFDGESAYFCDAGQQRVIADQNWISSRTD